MGTVVFKGILGNFLPCVTLSYLAEIQQLNLLNCMGVYLTLGISLIQLGVKLFNDLKTSVSIDFCV